jgi:1,4-alpha-glucan branching enzyme
MAREIAAHSTRRLPFGSFRPAAAALAAILILVPGEAAPADNDDNVEWFGVSHEPAHRSPRQPGKNQAFTVELRVFKGDITSARIRVWDGAERRSDMTWVRNEGPYDVYRGTVAGTGADSIYYRFEITDGADTDHLNALGMWGSPPPHGDYLVDTTSLGAHPLGATPVAGGIVFRVWAPGADTAAVAGTFNGWSTTAHPLSRNQGFWQGLVPGAAAGSEYKFVLDGGTWRTDPRARRQVSSVGNSIVVDPSAHEWGDEGWVTPYFEDMVIYELHVGSFSGEGDGVSRHPAGFRDVVDAHLGHLLELGINVIELLPVGEFAGDLSWGYNPAFQFAPESAYGSPDDLKYLVDRCHQSGIAVILDVVYNHMGPSDLAGNILEYDGDEIYFYPEGNGYRETPWGPRLDYGRVEVRDYIRDNVRYWLEELHLDGLRIDATDFIKVNAEGWEVLKDIARAADSVSPKAIIIAEQLPNDPAVSQPIADGGAGLDAQWNDAFHDTLRQAIQDAAFGDPNMGAVAGGVNHFGLPGTVVNYIESHDEAAHQGRISVVADSSNPSSEFAHGRSKVAAALVLFSAGIPMLLQGQELLESRPFGDARENRIRWGLRAEHSGFLQFMKDAIGLRRTQPALRSSSPQNVFLVNEGANLMAIHRWAGTGDDLVVLVSFSNAVFSSYHMGFPLDGEWFEVLNSDAAVYGGSNVGNGGMVTVSGPGRDGLPHSTDVVIPRRGVLVFARRPLPSDPPPSFVSGDCNGDDVVDISDALRILFYLFRAAGGGDCLASCDAGGDGAVSVTDAIGLLGHLFRGGPPPAAPWPECGPNPGTLECGRRCAGS